MLDYRYIDPRVLHVSQGTRHNLIDPRVNLEELILNLGFTQSVIAPTDIENFVTDDLLTTEPRTHTIDHDLILLGTGSQLYHSTDGTNKARLSLDKDVSTKLSCSGPGTVSSIEFTNPGDLLLESTTRSYKFVTYPTLNSSASANILMMASGGVITLALFEAFRPLTTVGENPTNGVTNAWHSGQLVINADKKTLFRVITPATLPDAGNTAGSTFEPLFNVHYPDRDSIETASSNEAVYEQFEISDRYRAQNDAFNGTSHFVIDLKNPLNTTPSVAAATTISVEIFTSLGKRVAGGSWEYNATKDIGSIAPDASEPSTISYGANSTVLDINGDPVGISGWSDVASYFVGSTFNVTNHTFTLQWDKRKFALNHNLANSYNDNVPAGRWEYIILVSIQEAGDLVSKEIRVPTIEKEGALPYAYQHMGDNSEQPVMAWLTGSEVVIGNPVNHHSTCANLLGRNGLEDVTNASMAVGQGKQTNSTMFFTNLSWDEQIAAVDVGWTSNLHPLLISAPQAWYGVQTGNTGLWLITPNAAYNDDIFVKNFDFSFIPVDPFGGDTADPAYVTGVFDKFQTANGKTSIWAQDQQLEMYYMEYDGANYVNISSVPWTLQANKLVEIRMPDIDTMVVVSRSGNTGNTAFELYEYNAGNREDQASWTRTLIASAGAYCRGIWQNNTTSNGKLIFYTLDVNNGQVVSFTYNGVSYVVAKGNAVLSVINDLTVYCGEVQSLDVLKSQGSLTKVIYTHSRKLYNREAYGDFLFAANGLLMSQYNETAVTSRNGNYTLTESTLYY